MALPEVTLSLSLSVSLSQMSCIETWNRASFTDYICTQRMKLNASVRLSSAQKQPYRSTVKAACDGTFLRYLLGGDL